MLELAEREKLEVVAIRRESHSAKDTGQREVYNELLMDVRTGKFNGIITWAPDRLSRNAGDLGAIVDMMDQGLLQEIRTHGQTFTNSPNEKFLLMILGSQAKLENDHRVLNNTFYYGRFEYPKGSGNWYQGKHKPIVTQTLFEKAQEQLKRDNIVKVNKEFAFTKLMTCGLCQSGVCAQEKFKQLKDGTHAKYIYYGCSRGKDRHCKNKYIREKELISQLAKIIDKMDIDALGIKCRLEEELKRFSKFQRIVLGSDGDVSKEKQEEINVRTYAKYLLREGSITEKRFLLGNLRSKLIYENKRVVLVES